MASKGKKKKPQPARAVAAGELLKLAEDRLQAGRPEEAIRLLQEVEDQLRRSAVPAGSKGRPASGVKGQPHAPALPPHLAALQPRVAPLLARAYFERALAVPDAGQRIADLESAVKRAPTEPRYHLGLGAGCLALGQPEPAFESIRQAHELAPDDPLVDRVFALGLLAAGHTREVKEWLKRPKASLDAPEQRLAAIRELIVRNVEAAGGSERPQPSAAPRPGSAGEAMAAQLIGSLSLLESGDVARARERLSALPPLDRNPNRGEAAVLATQLFCSGLLEFQAGRFREAAGEFREAVRLARGHAVTAPWLDRVIPYFHQIAEKAIQENDIQQAADLWNQILEQDPSDRVAAANFKAVRGVRASEAWRRGEWQQAVELWKEALRSNPHDEQLLRSLAIGAEKVGQKDEAIDHWRALAQIWRQQAKRRAGEAGFTARLMRLEEHLVELMLEADRPPVQVLYELESALKIDAANDALRRQYADLLIELGRTEQALKQLETIERSRGESAELLAQKGMTLDLLGRHAAARQALARALELEPSHPVARQGYLLVLDQEGLAAEQRGDYTRARAICEEQLSLDPKYAPAMAHLAILAFGLGDEQEARSMIARLIAAEPTNPRRYITAGSIYLAYSKVRLADAEFKRAIDLESSEPCYYFVGHAYLKGDKIKKALKHFERAAAFGSLETLMSIVGELIEADYGEEAQPFLDQALAKYPHHPEPHVARATMWLDEGRLAEARSELEQAERLAARSSEYAEILEEIRALKQEIKHVQRLGDLGPPVPGMPALPPEFVRLFGKQAGRG